jgi:hypothetical protein
MGAGTLQPAGPAAGDDGRLHPTRILRMGMMVEALLMEVRHVVLDADARDLLTDIYRRSIIVLTDALPPDLAQELSDLLPSFRTPKPGQAELQIAHAQLHGWLAGLLQGLQVASVSQHLEAHRQLTEMRLAAEQQRRAEDAEVPPNWRTDVAYL